MMAKREEPEVPKCDTVRHWENTACKDGHYAGSKTCIHCDMCDDSIRKCMEAHGITILW